MFSNVYASPVVPVSACSSIAHAPFDRRGALGASSILFVAALAVMMPIGNAFALQAPCVTSVEQLQTALASAQSNGDDDDIRIREGVFAAPPGGFSASMAESDADKALRVSGAWLEGCAKQGSNPTGTELNGGGTGRVLDIRFNTIGAAGAVSVSSLTIADGADNGGAFQYDNANSVGPVTIDRVAFTGNVGDVSGAFYLATGGRLLFTNNLSVGNSSALYRPVGAITLINGGQAALINNTFADNVAPFYRAIDIGSQNHNTYLFQNNIFHNGADGMPTQSVICVGNQAMYTAFVSNYMDSANCDGASVVNPLQAGTIFDAGGYRLAFGSGLIDAGTIAITPQGAWNPVLPALDFYGRPRVFGASVDPGAIEYEETIFDDDFELP